MLKNALTALAVALISTTALAAERVQSLLAGKSVRKVVVVPGKLVNIVVG